MELKRKLKIVYFLFFNNMASVLELVKKLTWLSGFCILQNLKNVTVTNLCAVFIRFLKHWLLENRCSRYVCWGDFSYDLSWSYLQAGPSSGHMFLYGWLAQFILVPRSTLFSCLYTAPSCKQTHHRHVHQVFESALDSTHVHSKNELLSQLQVGPWLDNVCHSKQKTVVIW